MRIVVINHLASDGATQAPGGPDEESSGGFRYGGWGRPDRWWGGDAFAPAGSSLGDSTLAEPLQAS
jgi:hypothetical protein